MSNEDYCLLCFNKLNTVIDSFPNGEMCYVCAQCRAYSEHDFDVEPNVEFNRLGGRIRRVQSGGEQTGESHQ